MKITSKQLRNNWIKFYEQRGHVNIGAVSLIGDGTTGVMFNVAGMQPLMPYLLGEKHPQGTRLCNVQGCVRTVDIESVGDASHFTFFEMMGNWSLGDYFKQEKTKWSFELLTEVFGLERDKIENEYAELMKLIAELQAILADEKKLLMVIREEITAISVFSSTFLRLRGWEFPCFQMGTLCPYCHTSFDKSS